jgi:hypothetical protein
MHYAEAAKTLWQITPRNPCPIAIKHGLYKQPVVICRTSDRSPPARQQLFDTLSLIIPQPITTLSHDLRLLFKQTSAYDEFDDTH